MSNDLILRAIEAQKAIILEIANHYSPTSNLCRSEKESFDAEMDFEFCRLHKWIRKLKAKNVEIDYWFLPNNI
jgi:hypothetical protein